MNWSSRLIDRRRFLKGTATTGAILVGGGLLAACGGEDEGGETVGAPKEGDLPGSAGGENYDGLTLTVASLAGPVGLPVELFRGDWEEATGAKIELVTFPFGDIHAKYKTAFAAGQHIGDIMHFGADFSGDIMGGGFMRPLPTWVQDRLSWNDVLEIYRERILTWGGELQAAPYDGDTTSLYFRKDVFENADIKSRFEDELGIPAGPPSTWEQAISVAKFFYDWDWSNRGSASYGMALQMKPNDSQFFYYPAVAASFAKVEGNPSFYFDAESFEPLVNNEGWVRGLEVWAELGKYGPPGVLNSGTADIRSQFAGGDVFMALDWADMGTLSYDPKASVVKGKTGFALTPGSEEVFNPDSQSWESAADINYAPLLAWNGWVAGVPVSTPDEKVQAAWDFISYMSSREISMKSCLTPASGVNPYRQFHLSNVSAWVEGSAFQKENDIPAGFPSDADASQYLETVRSCFEHPNVVLDLRVPGTFDYFDALDKGVSAVVAGNESAQDGLDGVAEEWNAITERLGGSEKQLEFYRASLGLS
jgi:multiple sugar transport system substrate-binding protein